MTAYARGITYYNFPEEEEDAIKGECDSRGLNYQRDDDGCLLVSGFSCHEDRSSFAFHIIDLLKPKETLH